MMALILPLLTIFREAWASKIGRAIIIGAGAIFALWAWGEWREHQGRADCKAEWRASVERARAAIAADDREAARLSKASDDEFTTILALEATKRAEKYRALADQIQDGSCVVGPADADALGRMQSR